MKMSSSVPAYLTTGAQTKRYPVFIGHDPSADLLVIGDLFHNCFRPLLLSQDALKVRESGRQSCSCSS
jgi:hypothetical protein